MYSCPSAGGIDWPPTKRSPRVRCTSRARSPPLAPFIFLLPSFSPPSSPSLSPFLSLSLSPSLYLYLSPPPPISLFLSLLLPMNLAICLSLCLFFLSQHEGRKFSLCFSRTGGNMVLGGYDSTLIEPGEYHQYTPTTLDTGFFVVEVRRGLKT